MHLMVTRFSVPDMVPHTGRVGRCSESFPLIELTQVHSVINLLCDLGQVTASLSHCHHLQRMDDNIGYFRRNETIAVNKPCDSNTL